MRCRYARSAMTVTARYLIAAAISGALASACTPRVTDSTGEPGNPPTSPPVTKSVYTHHDWSMTLARKWTVQEAQECATFVGPDKLGGLRICTYHQGKPLAPADVLSVVKVTEGSPQAELAKCRYGDFTGYALTYDTGDVRWLKWWLYNDRTLLVITYASAIGDETVEQEAVQRMLGSLRKL